MTMFSANVCRPGSEMTESNTTVKIALMLAGVSQADIATQLRVYPSAVSAVVAGRGRSKKIENRIASATGVPRERLWPQWYGPEAQRRRRRSMTPAALTAALDQLSDLAKAS